MLKLERVSSNNQLTLKKSERRLIDKPLIRALLWSALIHASLLVIFRVSLFDIPESIYQPTIEVHLENDIGEGASVRAHIQSNSDTPLLTDILHSCAWENTQLQNAKENSLKSPSSFFKKAPTMLYALSTEDTLPLNLHLMDTLHRVYPLKIKASSSLKMCKIIEDGSAFFKEIDVSLLPLHRTTRARIEYFVVLDGMTGKIKQMHRTRELLDKTLQSVADTIIDMLRFWMPEENEYKGRIELCFYCSGEEIQNAQRGRTKDT